MEATRFFKSFDLDSFCADMDRGVRGQFYTKMLDHVNDIVRRRSAAHKPPFEITVAEAKPPAIREYPSHTFMLGTIVIDGRKDSEIWMTYSQFHDGTEYVALDDRVESMRFTIRM